jgi:dGTPase
VVDLLEQRYGGFDGLNLTFETREGILKHCSRRNARGLGEVGERFLTRKQPSLEAQVANLADEIAYNNHDVDDGLRSGLLAIEALAEVPFFSRHMKAALRDFPGLTGRRLIHETVRRMIDTLATDLAAETRRNLRRHRPSSIDEVRSAPPIAGFSAAVGQLNAGLKQFLRQNLYRHYRVARMTAKAQRIVTDLFAAFLAEPTLMPPEFRSRAGDGPARVIADYIAGMTDRYAMLEHRRLFAIEQV